MNQKKSLPSCSLAAVHGRGSHWLLTVTQQPLASDPWPWKPQFSLAWYLSFAIGRAGSSAHDVHCGYYLLKQQEVATWSVLD